MNNENKRALAMILAALVIALPGLVVYLSRVARLWYKQRKAGSDLEGYSFVNDFGMIPFVSVCIFVAFSIATIFFINRFTNSKNVMSKKVYVLYTQLPDGRHWFAGVGTMPGTGPGGKFNVPAIAVNYTTPYVDQAARFAWDEAKTVNEKILSEAAGFLIDDLEAAEKYAAAHPFDPTAFTPNTLELKPINNENQQPLLENPGDNH